MDVVKPLIILLLFCHLPFIGGSWFDQSRMKCSTNPFLSSRIGKVISQCQSEVKSDLIDKLLAPFDGQTSGARLNYGPRDDLRDHLHHDLAENIYNLQPFHAIPHDHHALPHHHSPSHIHGHPPINPHNFPYDPFVFGESPDHHTFFHPSIPFDPYHLHSHGSQPIFQNPYAVHSHHEPHHPIGYHHEPQHHIGYHHEPFNFKPLHHTPYHHEHHHDSHLLSQHFTKPIHVVEAHEALAHVLAVNMPKNLHESHHEISSVLDKLRNGKRSVDNQDDASDSAHEKRDKRSLFASWAQANEKAAPDSSKLSNEDRWLVGCLLHCVFEKNDALDNFGKPTLEGLTKVFTSGTTERDFYLHVLTAVEQCLKTSSEKYQTFRGSLQIRSKNCDAAFDLFDCISDSVTSYCP